MALTTPFTTTVDDLHESSYDMAFEAKIMSNLEFMIKHTTKELKIKCLYPHCKLLDKEGYTTIIIIDEHEHNLKGGNCIKVKILDSQQNFKRI